MDKIGELCLVNNTRGRITGYIEFGRALVYYFIDFGGEKDELIKSKRVTFV